MPTISVWVGDAGALEPILGRTILWSNGATFEAVANDWWCELQARRDLPAEAFRLIARERGEPESELHASWLARSVRERRMWLDQARTPALGGALELLRGLLESEPIAGDPALSLRRALGWLPEPECLGVRNADALRGVLALAVEAPHLSILAQLCEHAWTRFLPALDDRSRTRLEQGVIARAIPPAARPTETLAHMQHAMTQARSARDRGSPELRELDSRARSAAEARLFELLQLDPVTRDLFELNGRMPFTFGNARAEVDLVCTELRVAVEIDGYFHFQEWDAYRRDRRKDVLLQHQGYLVSRHLAEDVEQRAGEVMRAIRELVKRRRRRRRRENAE